jgi:abhydrolase domain-containing protein 17
MRHFSGANPDKYSKSELLAVTRRVLLILASLYALLAVGAHLIAYSMIFPRPPASYQLTADYVQLTAADGVKLVGRHWARPGAKFTVLYLHGNYEDLGGVGGYVGNFLREGYAVFSIDYRHYGRSEGEPTEANTNADVRLAYDYVRTNLGVPADRIIIWGFSVGSGPAVELALRVPAAGLVLQNAYVSTYRVMTHVPLLPGDKFVNLAKMPRLKLPVLFYHGLDDRTIPSWHGEALYAATTSRKARLFVPGGRHTRLADTAGPEFWTTLKAFSDSL